MKSGFENLPPVGLAELARTVCAGTACSFALVVNELVLALPPLPHGHDLATIPAAAASDAILSAWSRLRLRSGHKHARPTFHPVRIAGRRGFVPVCAQCGPLVPPQTAFVDVDGAERMIVHHLDSVEGRARRACAHELVRRACPVARTPPRRMS
jgi:hypothetical protein